VKSVLALLDFSGVTDAVVKTAVDMVRAFQSKLILLHVATPDADYEGDEMRTDISRTGVAGEMHRYHRELQKITTDCTGAGIDVTALLVRGTSARGNPVQKILEEVDRVRPDLIVVGSHGHGRIHDILLGSVSSAVIRKAPCPVVVVPALKHLPVGTDPVKH